MPHGVNKNIPSEDTALHATLDYLTYNGKLYVHNSRIIDWPNRSLAGLLTQLPLSRTPWVKAFGKAKYQGKYTFQGATPAARMYLGHKDDTYFVEDNWLASIGRGQSLVDMHFIDGTTPDEVVQALNQLIARFTWKKPTSQNQKSDNC